MRGKRSTLLFGNLPPRKQGALSHKQSAFTLIELLVVISIIGILASLMLPGLSSAKEQARMTTCINNLRQLGIAISLYIDDFEFKYPPGSVVDVDNLPKPVSATLGGFDPLPTHAPYIASARKRPLYNYVRPSESYKCPMDKGQSERPPCDMPPLKPSNFTTIGCSYQYNSGDLQTPSGGGFRQPRAGGLALESESWVPEPEKYILMYEPPARVYGCGAALWTQWHQFRGRSDIPDPVYARQRFISPILFADGHVAVQNFSRALTTDPLFPYEPTKEWVWYKPAGGLASSQR